MATINPAVEVIGDGSIRTFAFSTLTTTNADGAGIALDQHVDCSVQILGTFGSGGTIVWEGSNDGGVTWATLDDIDGNAISIQAAAIAHCRVPVDRVRPRVTAGDGTTDLDVHVRCRRENGMRQ